MTVTAFLSYSHKNGKLAHEVKLALEKFKIHGFLAHDDIRVSERWKREIRKHFRDCDLFIPILTDAFTKSDWTDQECGLALGHGKKIVPLKVDQGPYGFLGAYQAIILNEDDPTRTCWKIAESLVSDTKLGRAIRIGAIAAFLGNSSFDETVRYTSALLKMQPFSTQQIEEIIKGSTRNRNIYGCFRVQPELQRFIKENESRISKITAAKFRKAVELWNDTSR